MNATMLSVLLFISFVLGASCQHKVDDRLNKLEENMKEFSVQLRILTTNMEKVMHHINIKLQDPVENGDSETGAFKKTESVEINEPTSNLMNDTNLEERVAVLEFQMATVTEDLTTVTEELEEVEDRVVNTEGQITVIFADQVIQDERLLDVEDNVEVVQMGIVAIEETVDNLEASDIRINATVTELGAEVTAATLLVEHLEETVDDLEQNETMMDARLEELEELVAILQQTDEEFGSNLNELDTIVSELSINETVAFHAWLNTYTTIPEGSVVIFQAINVNLGNGYNGSSGEFTVPAGKGGLYYFFAHFRLQADNRAVFDIVHNEDVLCNCDEDEDLGGDYSSSSCGAVVIVKEGDIIRISYADGTDDSPLYNSNSPRSSFTGFRIAPEF